MTLSRKTRSDKKRDVKPTVHASLYETVSRLSYITNIPMKDVAENFCLKGLYSLEVIETFKFKFRRSYIFNHSTYPTIFPGDSSKIGERAVKDAGLRRRITIRFEQDTHDKLAELAFSLDVTVSSATSLLLDTSITNSKNMNDFLEEFAEQSLDEKRKAQLMEVVRYLRSKNQFHDTDISFMDILGSIFEEIWEYGKNLKSALEKWLDSETETIHSDD